MLHVEIEVISPRKTVASRKNLSHSFFEKQRKFDNFSNLLKVRSSILIDSPVWLCYLYVYRFTTMKNKKAGTFDYF